MQLSSIVIRLYPTDVRYAYEVEMQAAFAAAIAHARRRSRVAVALVIIKEVASLVVDAAAERLSSLYSHRSFHGRREPDLGVVRPPNMSKAEWFGTASLR